MSKALDDFMARARALNIGAKSISADPCHNEIATIDGEAMVYDAFRQQWESLYSAPETRRLLFL